MMFGFLANAFNIFLYYPLFNGLILIYNYLPGNDFGLAIIILTAAIRIIIYPISVKAINSQRAMQKLQPKMKEIQEKYKNDKEKQAKETMELYRKEKINPFSGLFLTLIQIPILIALYRVFWNGLKPEEFIHLYKFIASPVQINPMFFGLLDLAKPSVLLAVLAAAVQFFQTKMLMPQDKNTNKKGDMAAIMQKQMVYFFPLLTIVFLFKLPAALGLYWTASGIFSIIQQWFVFRKTQI